MSPNDPQLLTELNSFLSFEPVRLFLDSRNKASHHSLARELKIMSHVRPHVNVLYLIGACTRDIENKGLFIVTELCENGSLRDYIIKNRSNFENRYAEIVQQVSMLEKHTGSIVKINQLILQGKWKYYSERHMVNGFVLRCFEVRRASVPEMV